jgi:dTMP kinase
MKHPGKFITFEGGEGAGKSTQAELLAKRLAGKGIDVVTTREPGGTPGAELVRQLLKTGMLEPLGPFTETIMVTAARDDHLNEVIRPALNEGKWVISDRFADSTRAYQGSASGVAPEIINALERIVVGDDQPDLTLLLDLSLDTGLERAKSRAGEEGVEDDRFDRQDKEFHKNLREAFQAIAEQNPDRIVVVDAGRRKRSVSSSVWKVVQDRLLS